MGCFILLLRLDGLEHVRQRPWKAQRDAAVFHTMIPQEAAETADENEKAPRHFGGLSGPGDDGSCFTMLHPTR